MAVEPFVDSPDHQPAVPAWLDFVADRFPDLLNRSEVPPQMVIGRVSVMLIDLTEVGLDQRQVQLWMTSKHAQLVREGERGVTYSPLEYAILSNQPGRSVDADLAEATYRVRQDPTNYLEHSGTS